MCFSTKILKIILFRVVNNVLSAEVEVRFDHYFARCQHSQYALEVLVAGIGCAIRRDSLSLEREMYYGVPSGRGLVCRRPGVSRHGIQESWRHETVGKEIFCAP